MNARDFCTIVVFVTLDNIEETNCPVNSTSLPASLLNTYSHLPSAMQAGVYDDGATAVWYRGLWRLLRQAVKQGCNDRMTRIWVTEHLKKVPT